MVVASHRTMVDTLLVAEEEADLADRCAREVHNAGLHHVAARNVSEAKALIHALAPRVVVSLTACTRQLPRGALAELSSLSGECPHIVVTADYSVEVALELLTAALVLPLPLPSGALIEGIRAVMTRQRDDLQCFAVRYRLSPQEAELLRCAVAGMNNDEAADVLRCQRATISTYWNRIFAKTSVRGQRDVIVLLMRTVCGWSPGS